MFSNLLISWYRENKRELPWRSSKSPYVVWISEIMCQQTTVSVVIPYFMRFIEKFPDIEALSNADENELLKLWQGLGYYSRARNLYRASKTIVRDFHAEFPDNYRDLLQLPGIGEYTAGAVASIAFGEKVPAVDGNVVRVLARFFGIEMRFDTPAGKKIFRKKAAECIGNHAPGELNQALMEFGALVCTPRTPRCPDCVLKNECTAFQIGKIDKLPKKKEKIKLKERSFIYFVLKNGNKIALRQRTQNDIWQNLYEFPGFEISAESATKSDFCEMISISCKNLSDSKIFWTTAQKLTHQKISAEFRLVDFGDENFTFFDNTLIYVCVEDFEKYPVPKIIAQAFDVLSRNYLR